MNDKSIYFIATLMGGAVLPVQVALNALLRRYVGQPMQAAAKIGTALTLALTIAGQMICALLSRSLRCD
jgi:transporter family-2 protein